ncbi:MAG: SPOR domain-containing protein [Prevotella sp.]
MIEIERHIEILLLDNDCVIVPGLGGFTAHHVEARFDEADGVFVPPLRTLGFNAQLKINDSLLAQSYVEAYDISYPEALRKIESEVEELRQRLANDGYYELTDIGVLETNEDGNIEFTPCEAGILTPDLYGLSSFEMQPLAVEAEENVTKPSVQPHTPNVTPITTTLFDQPKVDSKPEEVDANDNSGDKTEEEAEKTICIKVSWLRNAGIAAAAAIVLILMLMPMTHPGFKNVNIGDFNGTSFFSKLMPKDSQMNSIDIKTIKESTKDSLAEKAQAKPNKDTVDIKLEKVSDVKTEKAAVDSFCIVIASSIPKSNAERYVKELHQKGLDKAHTYVRNNMVRVVYGCYASEGEAYKELNNVRSMQGFEQAWVLRVKN